MKTVRISAKTKFVQAAHKLFAERGFAAVSLADIAEDLGLTKQSILYHFKTKEALYGVVLEGLSERFEAILAQVERRAPNAESKWSMLLDALYQTMQDDAADARLIMRELLDNSERAGESNRWYLKEFLDQCVVFIGTTPRWSKASADEQRAAVYQAIGAINYLAVSEATLTAIWGADALKGLKARYMGTLHQE
jgi:AcrR family transcriptional regulator